MAPAGLLATSGLSGPLASPRVHQVDIRLEQGELLHVHGRSGSGKTTLLRLLSRIDPPHGGTLRLDDHDANEIPLTEWRRRVCLVFQESRVFPMNLHENLQWGARQHGLEADTHALLERVGLGLDPGTPAQRLSGGEAKRLAIARALAVKPDVLLLDEPTGPLDEEHRETLRSLIRRLQDDGLGVVFVSHLQEDLDLLPGHAVHLVEGRIQDEGPSRRLHQRLQEARP